MIQSVGNLGKMVAIQGDRKSLKPKGLILKKA